MSLISKYVIKAHIGPFIFGASTVMFLFLFQFILRYINELVGKGLSWDVIIQLIAFNLAWMVVLAVPLGVLFSTLMAFGGLSANHEVTIIKASGGSLLRMMMPVMIIGLILSYSLFLFNDEILPEANHQAKVLLSDIKRKKPTFDIEAGRFSTQLEGYTILARRVDSTNGKLFGVTIYDRTKSLYTNIVSADTGIVYFSAHTSKLVLDLYNGEIHQVKFENAKDYRIVKFDTYKISIKAEGFDLDRSDKNVISRGDRELHISDMKRIINDSEDYIKTEGSEYLAKVNDHLDFLTRKSDIFNSFSTEENNKFLVTDDERKAKIQPTDSNKVLRIIPNKAKNKITLPRSLSIAKALSDSVIVADTPESRNLKLLKDTLEILSKTAKRVSFFKSTIMSEISRIEDRELRIKQFNVEIQKKYAIPFACFIFIFVGCPLGIITRGGNFGLSAAMTLAFYIVYWVCLIGGEKLADRGLLSPVLSMWMGNFILGMIGLVLTLRVTYETWEFPFLNPIISLFKSK